MAPLCLPVVRPLPLPLPVSSPVLPLSAGAPLPLSVPPLLPLLGTVFVPALSHSPVLFIVSAVLLRETVLLGEGRGQRGAGQAPLRLALGAQLDGALDGLVGLGRDSSAPTPAAGAASTSFLVVGGGA